MCNFGVGMVEPTYRRKKGERGGREGEGDEIRKMERGEGRERGKGGKEGRAEGE